MSENQSFRLLIAEDQPMIRKALIGLLELESDFAVVAAVGDGAEAIRAARAYSPDIVLMDIKMPRVDGIEATRAILPCRWAGADPSHSWRRSAPPPAASRAFRPASPKRSSASFVA